MSVPEQAVVLAAGEGRRLRPHTLVRPKPLMPFLDVPLLRHTLRALARAGVRRVWVNAWHLAGQVEAFAAERPEPALDVTVVREERLLGTGGGLANLWRRMDRATTLLLLPDILADFDLEALAADHRARGAVATMALTAAADPAAYGGVDVDADGRLLDIAGLRGVETTPAGTFVNASAHVFEPEFLDRLPAEPSCFVRQGYVPALDDGLPCRGRLHEGAWFDTGTADALLDAQAAALEGQLPVDDLLLVDGGRRRGARAWVHGDAEVAEDAVLDDGTVVGAGAVVEAGVRLHRCLVLPGARVAAGTEARRRILGDADATPDRERAADAAEVDA